MAWASDSLLSLCPLFLLELPEYNMPILDEKSFHERFIYDLLTWMEDNLHTKLFITDIATRAGYSPWHLQKLFKMVTRVSLGEYVKNRKLSRAALVLRLTRLPIIDVAHFYSFDSQQTFSRAFKKHFHITPATYRQSSDWPLAGISLPFHLQPSSVPAVDIVLRSKICLLGKTEQHFSPIAHISSALNTIRGKLLRRIFSQVKKETTEFCLLTQSRPDDDKEDGLKINFTLASMLNENLHPISSDNQIIIGPGRYAKFSYEGNIIGLNEFIMAVYLEYLPMYKLSRRIGYDIEHYTQKSVNGTEEKSWLQFHCDYFVPVT